VAKQEDMLHSFNTMTPDKAFFYFKNSNLMTGGLSKFWHEFEIREKLQKQGVRTMLSGWGGDEFISIMLIHFIVNFC
jgi:hypothetical protein